LQLCDEDFETPDNDDTDEDRMQRVNMQVLNCSTAANYFHALRRQMRRTYRKPLIVIAPKKLLKYARANSDLEAF
jgi:2-oxoglutarate dehydrogenase E1 component